jgi:hypothetical protein
MKINVPGCRVAVYSTVGLAVRQSRPPSSPPGRPPLVGQLGHSFGCVDVRTRPNDVFWT